MGLSLNQFIMLVEHNNLDASISNFVYLLFLGYNLVSDLWIVVVLIAGEEVLVRPYGVCQKGEKTQ